MKKRTILKVVLARSSYPIYLKNLVSLLFSWQFSFSVTFRICIFRPLGKNEIKLFFVVSKVHITLLICMWNCQYFLFSLGRFSNIPCAGTTGDNGTCYSQNECRFVTILSIYWNKYHTCTKYQYQSSTESKQFSSHVIEKNLSFRF